MKLVRWIITWLMVTMLLSGLYALRVQDNPPAEAQEEEPTHTIFLPIILSRTALKGAALTGPYSAVGQLETRWYYNWGRQPPAAAPIPDPLFVPMIWGSESMGHLAEAVATAEAGSGWLIGFNEPDMENQANISPEEAAIFWHQIEQQATNIKLVSPAASQHNPNWLWQMVNEYQGRYGVMPRFDAIAWHIYTGDPGVAKSYLMQRHNEALPYDYDVPFWITEWGGLCTLPDPENGSHTMMSEMIPWMQQQPWIVRYAWFATHIAGDEEWGPGWQHCSLIDVDTGELTELGEFYRGI